MLHPESVLCVGCKVGSLRAYTPRVADYCTQTTTLHPFSPHKDHKKAISMRKFLDLIQCRLHRKTENSPCSELEIFLLQVHLLFY